MFVTLKEAFERVSVAHCWDMAPNPNGVSVPLRDGVVKSPFRLDKRGASFSLSKNLMVFKDHAEDAHKGGAWAFIALCRPEWAKRDIARCMIELAGGDPDQQDPNAKRKTAVEWRAEKELAQARAREAWQREQLGLATIEPAKLQAAPLPVARRYELSLARGAESPEWLSTLAAERGWPLEWVEHLVSQGRMACGPKLQPEFAVEKFCNKSGGFELCGVHGRWFTDDGRKMWSYRPCLKWDKVETVALPFVLGRVEAPVWVVTEGQWDATTVYGMVGGFDEYPALDVAVFGIRGASGVGVFMSHYQQMLRRVKPIVVLLPDADAAAKGWTEDIRKREGDRPTWCFARRLREIFGVRVKWMRCPAHKDINDWWSLGDLTAGGFVGALRGVVKI